MAHKRQHLDSQSGEVGTGTDSQGRVRPRLDGQWVEGGHGFGPIADHQVGPPRLRRPRLHAHGLVCRISPIKGVTPKQALDHHFHLPVLLNNVTETLTALHNEFETLSHGQFSEAPQGGKHATQLREIPLDTLTMDWEPRWFTVRGYDAVSVGEALERIHDWRAPVHLLITRHPPRHPHRPVVNYHVTFRGLTKEERPGEADTRYLSIDMKQWRNASGHRRTTHRPNLPTTHKLKSDDTLRSLSKRYYGTYAHWRLIRDANGIKHRFGGSTPLVRLPGKWKVGQKIRIPSIGSRVQHKSRPGDRVGGG